MTRTRTKLCRSVAVGGALAVLLAGCGLPERVDRDDPDDRGNEPGSWEQAAAAIDGIAEYREADPDLLTNGHVDGPVRYEIRPPVGGDHNPAWQNCAGTVYQEPIADEHAVHSLEHGAVWLTHQPSLPADQVDQLRGVVAGQDKLMLSPYPGLDAPISLQAWGYQLKVDDAADPRIAEFVQALRVNASIEGPTATCDGGTTATGPLAG